MSSSSSSDDDRRRKRRKLSTDSESDSESSESSQSRDERGGRSDARRRSSRERRHDDRSARRSDGDGDRRSRRSAPDSSSTDSESDSESSESSQSRDERGGRSDVRRRRSRERRHDDRSARRSDGDGDRRSRRAAPDSSRQRSRRTDDHEDDRRVARHKRVERDGDAARPRDHERTRRSPDDYRRSRRHANGSPAHRRRADDRGADTERPSRDGERTDRRARERDGAADARSKPSNGNSADNAVSDRAPQDAAVLATDDAAAVANGKTADAGAARKSELVSKTGGVYIPPFKLAQMMQQCTDKTSPQYQRMTWDALRKSINGLVNKVNKANLKNILFEIFQENLNRGKGLLCRSLMKSQMASPAFTPVYAALVAAINTKLPEIGELLLGRILAQFKRAYKRNDKQVCIATITFIAHLINQGVAHEVLALEILFLLVETPTDDSVEVAVNFTKEIGATLQDLAPQGLQAVFERFRAILHEGQIDKRVQFTIEQLFAIRKAGFEKAGFPAVAAELDIVEEGDQIQHEIDLQTPIDVQGGLDVFKADPEYEQHEKEWEAIKREILGDDESEDADDEGEDDEDEDEDEEGGAGTVMQTTQRIEDQTGTNLVNLRRTIYLTIMSSLDFEEAGHKLLKIPFSAGQEVEVCTMIVECCSQERTYLRYYGLLAQRFAQKFRPYQECFEDLFVKQYAVVHQLDTNKLRNVSKLLAHLLGTDAISWSVLSCIRLTEEDTTSASRIFIKYMFQELSENLGLIKLNARLQEPTCQEWFAGLFPRDNMKNMRFSINFFTAIGLGGLTDRMRDDLLVLQEEMKRKRAELASQAAAASGSSSSSSSDSSSASDSSSGSGSDSSGSSSSSSDSSDTD